MIPAIPRLSEVCLHQYIYEKRPIAEIQPLIPRFLNTKDERGLTPLHLACALGNADIVQRLLAANAPTEETFGEDKRTALHIVAERGHQAIVPLLQEAGAK